MFGWLKFWDRRRNPPVAQPAPPAPRPSPPPPPARPPLEPEHEALLSALEDPSPEARDAAAEALTRAGAPVVPALADAMSHKSAAVRKAAALVLGEIGPDAAPALTALVRAAIDRDEGVRQAASQALARVDPAWAITPATRRALPAVVEGLRSDLPWVSRAAAALLLRVGRPAVPALVELLADWEREAHRLAAIHLLEQLGPSAADAAPAFADLLAGSDPQFRLAAAEALAKMGSGARDAMPALIRALSDWSPPVRRGAARALGGLGATAAYAIPTLIGLLADYDDGARAAASAALAGIGEPAMPLLAQALAEGELRRLGERAPFRQEVDRLWRRLEAEGGHPVPDRSWRDLTWVVREGLREQTDVVHQGAALALGRLGPLAEPAVPVLAQALSDEGHLARVAAAKALGEIGPAARPALPPLAAALVRGTKELRKAVAEALPRIDADWSGDVEAGRVLPALVARLTASGPRAAEAADALALIGG